MEGKVEDLHILDQRPALDHELTWKVSVLMMVMRVLLGGHDGYIIALIEDTCTTPWSANKSHYIWYLQKYPILAVFGPSCRPGQIFMVQNGWHRCPAYSTTCFMLDLHLIGVF